jgi:hypothetical protein
MSSNFSSFQIQHPYEPFTDQQGAPPHYIKALEKFLVTNPMDIHFIMELGKEGTGLGGNGFGSVTCTCFPFPPHQARQTLTYQRHGRLLLGSTFSDATA